MLFSGFHQRRILPLSKRERKALKVRIVKLSERFREAIVHRLEKTPLSKTISGVHPGFRYGFIPG